MRILILEDSEAKFHHILKCICAHSQDHTIAWWPTYRSALDALSGKDTYDIGIFDNNMQRDENDWHPIKECGLTLATRNAKTSVCKKVFILTSDFIKPENIAWLNKYENSGDVEHLEYSVFDTGWSDRLTQYLEEHDDKREL